ncbi:MAG TPA: zf-HC2 domain-containing protein [Candidatus Polarisedimenticolia bacterium]|nr:zf-HC2 domain-containing protein [Candidatus Polarisedimenticolia bacterium]
MKENLSCEDCQLEMLALIDGTLTPSVARVIEGHAASCVSCAPVLDAYRLQSHRLRHMPLIPAPAGLEDAVMRRVLGARRFWNAGWQRVGAATGAASFALTVALLVSLPRIARDLGLSDPYVWLVSALDHSIATLTTGSKWLASEIAFYVPLAKQLWLATLALQTLPRAALVMLRTTEVQVAGALFITLGLALYVLLRPSRRHEGSVGHVCLSL